MERTPKAVPKKPKGAMKPPEPAKGPTPMKAIPQKGSMRPPEPKLPPKKATAKKSGPAVDPKASGKATAMPTTTGTIDFTDLTTGPIEMFEQIAIPPKDSNVIPCRHDWRRLACISCDCTCDALSDEMLAKLPEEVLKPSPASISN